MLLTCDSAQRPAVVLIRWNSDGLKQKVRLHVMRMGDERHAHPGADRFILAADVAHMQSGPIAENKRSGDGQNQSQSENKLSLPRLLHGSNIALSQRAVRISSAYNAPSGVSSCLKNRKTSLPSLSIRCAAAAIRFRSSGEYSGLRRR